MFSNKRGNTLQPRISYHFSRDSSVTNTSNNHIKQSYITSNGNQQLENNRPIIVVMFHCVLLWKKGRVGRIEEDD